MRLPNTCHSGLSGNNKAFIVDRGTSGAGSNLGLVDEGAAGTGAHDCNNWGFWRKQECGGSCGAEVGPWACDNFSETSGCEGDCEVRFHTGADAGDGLLMSYWDDYVAFGEVSFNGTIEDLEWVWDEDGCTEGNQYYLKYVNSGEEHFHLELCPELCAAVDDNTTEFEFDFACYTFDTSFSGSVAYEGSCPVVGTRVTWQYAGWNAVTPGDTSILFEVRTASTHADLADADWQTLADVSSDDVSPSCLFDDPDSDCPVSLFAALSGPPLATNEFIEIRYTLYSGGGGSISPALYDLQVSYTCPDTE